MSRVTGGALLPVHIARESITGRKNCNAKTSRYMRDASRCRSHRQNIELILSRWIVLMYRTRRPRGFPSWFTSDDRCLEASMALKAQGWRHDTADLSTIEFPLWMKYPMRAGCIQLAGDEWRSESMEASAREITPRIFYKFRTSSTNKTPPVPEWLRAYEQGNHQ